MTYDKMTSRKRVVAMGAGLRERMNALAREMARGEVRARCLGEGCEAGAGAGELTREEVVGNYYDGFYHKGHFGHEVHVSRVRRDEDGGSDAD